VLALDSDGLDSKVLGEPAGTELPGLFQETLALVSWGLLSQTESPCGAASYMPPAATSATLFLG